MNNASKHVLWLLASVEEATPRQLESLAEWLAFVKSCVTPEVAKHLHAACVAHVAHVKGLPPLILGTPRKSSSLGP